MTYLELRCLDQAREHLAKELDTLGLEGLPSVRRAMEDISIAIDRIIDSAKISP